MARYKGEEMTREDCIAFISSHLRGIDQDAFGNDDGWWETSSGAEFGRIRLQKVLDTVNKAYDDFESKTKEIFILDLAVFDVVVF